MKKSVFYCIYLFLMVMPIILPLMILLVPVSLPHHFFKDQCSTINLEQLIVIFLIIGWIIFSVKFIQIFAELIKAEREHDFLKERSIIDNQRLEIMNQNAENLKKPAQRNPDFFKLLEVCKEKTETITDTRDKDGKVTETKTSVTNIIDEEKFAILLDRLNIKSNQ